MLGPAAVGAERRLGRVLQAELDGLRRLPASEFGDHDEREVDAGRDATARDDVPVAHDARWVRDRSERGEQVAGTPNGRRPACPQEPGGTQDQRSRADRGGVPGPGGEAPDRGHVARVGDRLGDAAAARHAEHVASLHRAEVGEVGETQSNGVHWLAATRGDDHDRARHPGKELVRPGEVELGHSVVDRHHDRQRLGHPLLRG